MLVSPVRHGRSAPAEAVELVTSVLTNPRSKTIDVDAKAAAMGKIIHVHIGKRGPPTKKHPRGVRIDGAKAQNIMRTITNRETGEVTVIKGIEVTIDTSESVIMKGVDAITKRRINSYVATDAEVLEHELLGHAQDFLDGVNRGEVNSINKESELRERSGERFRRTKEEFD